MRKESHIAVASPSTVTPRRLLRMLLVAGALALAAAAAPRADAGAALCGSGSACNPEPHRTYEAHRNGRYAAGLPKLGSDRNARRMELSEQDYSKFSGVGLIVCSAGGVTRTSTAFLVGQFDLGVTVAHTFELGSDQSEPQCSYNSMSEDGQVRERIPVAYVLSQWDADDATGEHAKDFAVVRLAEPSRLAHRTMPLGKFSGAPAAALMIGFVQDADVDTTPRMLRGRVYGLPDAEGEAASAQDGGYPHDIDSGGLVAGAPLVDEKTGIIIGIHTGAAAQPNSMIAMNAWLESTLRAELAAKKGEDKQQAKATDDGRRETRE